MSFDSWRTRGVRKLRRRQRVVAPEKTGVRRTWRQLLPNDGNGLTATKGQTRIAYDPTSRMQSGLEGVTKDRVNQQSDQNPFKQKKKRRAKRRNRKGVRTCSSDSYFCAPYFLSLPPPPFFFVCFRFPVRALPFTVAVLVLSTERAPAK